MMPEAFRKGISAALDNPELQAALDTNADRRAAARARAIATFEGDWEAARHEAHAIRAGTLANLDAHLEEFIARSRDNGWFVHLAAGQAEAIAAILQIAQDTHARLAAKSKTMLGEEIGLNHALERSGLEVVETDLGEYIVQLRGERPAHITTPAVHLRREDVARTFCDMLGIPLTDDVQALVGAARRALRQTFFSADLGISGVNFGIVETGGICLVTNEGNGRMVTTLPRVHIALMGLERLVPSLQDLAVLLSLLPGAATGQKLTVYTTLINAPRRGGDADGPEERHLILVDNCRSRVRVSPLAEALLCIRCGACLNACPIFREIGGHAYVGREGQPAIYPGPIGSILAPALFGLADFGHLARASSLCGACKEACPVDIDLPQLLLRVRAGEGATERRRPADTAPFPVVWGLRAFTWLATGSRRFHLGQRLAGLLARLLSPRSAWLRLPGITGWGFSKDFPRPSRRTFRDLWVVRAQTSGWPALRQNEQVKKSAQVPAATEQHAENGNEREKFADAWTANGGFFYRCQRKDLPGRLVQFLSDRQVDKLLTWEEGWLPPGLLTEVRLSGCSTTSEQDPEVRFGLTGADAAIAETGSLLLMAGPGRPQAPSLITEVHLVVLWARDICTNLTDAFKLSNMASAPAVTLISGPSRTADIELTLTVGVHGPREVHVFCVEE